MAHEIQVDSNTAVGYNFITKEYYIKNFDTKTTLNTSIEAKQILDVTAPFNNITENDIYNLSQALEPLKSIQYAWEDTGRYIKVIYFNDYKEHAMIYNEPYLYIKGSVELWNMSSSLSLASIRDFFWGYYTYNLGLDIDIEIMNKIINYYGSLQYPYVYNNISPREDITDTLMYTNTFTMNNINKNSLGEYIGIKNPNNIYDIKTYSVLSTEQNSKNIITTTEVPDVNIGDIMQLRGTINKNNLIVSYVDGKKIILSGTPNIGNHSEKNNMLYVNAYNILSIGYDNYEEILGVVGINKIDNNKIYIAGWLLDGNFQIGQEIYINYGNYDIKGPFTIKSVYPSNIVGETITDGYIQINNSPGDYTSTIGSEPVTIEVRGITKKNENSIIVEKTPTLNSNDIIEIKNSSKWDGSYVVDYIESKNQNTKIWIKKNTNFEKFTELYTESEEDKKAVLQLRTYSEQILLNMTYSKRTDRLPTGKFMLDNDQQFTNYLIAYGITTPSQINYANLNQPVNLKYYLGEGLDIEYMDCIGLFSEVFPPTN